MISEESRSNIIEEDDILDKWMMLPFISKARQEEKHHIIISFIFSLELENQPFKLLRQEEKHHIIISFYFSLELENQPFKLLRQEEKHHIIISFIFSLELENQPFKIRTRVSFDCLFLNLVVVKYHGAANPNK